MADYYPVLKRAIGSLQTNSGEARRAVYEKARAALVSQLKSYEPPLTQAEITDQRLQLEESIRRIESEMAGAAFGLPTVAEAVAATPVAVPAVRVDTRPAEAPEPAPAAPPRAETPKPDVRAPSPAAARVDPPPVRQTPPATPPKPSGIAGGEPASARPAAADPKINAGLSSLSKTVHEAEALGSASAQAVQSARGAMDDGNERLPETKVEPGFMDAPLGADLPPRGEAPAAAAGRNAPRPARIIRPQSPKVNLKLVAALILGVVLLAGGVFAWVNRDSFLGGDPVVETAAPGDEPPVAETRTTGQDGLEAKIPDRLPQDGEPAEPVAPDARAVQTERVTPPSDAPPEEPAPAPEPLAEAAPEPAPAVPPPAAAAPAPAGQSGQTVLVAQRAILYEEPIPGADGARAEGQVLWQFVNEPSFTGDAPVPQIRATIDIPDRGIKLTMQMRRNTDQALPASHIIEMQFALPDDFAGRSIDTTPGLILKQTEDARGDPLIGAVAKVQDNFFWLALSGTEQDTARNVALLRERQWFDVPIRYGNRRRAILTFVKGTPGDQAFTQALAAWGQ
ncbi:hypothetical protein [Chthonobacter rhizosphaerae]|uniref:hypothetical protein n=1 Tax=Chthonobacter rhizosphaerae TaxID=2735553 RepID=UPI0015EF398F|nr:hypothetical protein [Chthonobacter rhizosphaerae]